MVGILRWAFVGVAALMVGFGFAVLSGSFVPAAISALLVFLVACLTWERSPSRRPVRGASKRHRASGGTGTAATQGTADGGSTPGGACGPGGNGGGPPGGDGGGR